MVRTYLRPWVPSVLDALIDRFRDPSGFGFTLNAGDYADLRLFGRDSPDFLFDNLESGDWRMASYRDFPVYVRRGFPEDYVRFSSPCAREFASVTSGFGILKHRVRGHRVDGCRDCLATLVMET